LNRLSSHANQRTPAAVGPQNSWPKDEKCAEKFGEEAIEAIIEAVKGDRQALTSEAADVIYHLMVMLASRDIAFNDVIDELSRRSSISGIDEKSRR